MNKRQQYAITHPFDFLRHTISPDFQRQVGHFSTILTVDLRPEYLDMNNGVPEWHSSAGVMVKNVLDDLGDLKKIYDRANISMLNMFLWSEKAWKEAMNLCRAMLIGVGEGQGYWTGEASSIHYRKILTKFELEQMQKLIW